MDVRCENCGTEYDFEENRIPDAGLSVKCSQCHHVFIAHKPAFKPGPDPDKATKGEWEIRQANGNTFHFKEMTTLQRWIVERKVFRDDEISKGGKHWKRLGDIADLATFFQVVEAPAQHHPGHLPAHQAPQAPHSPSHEAPTRIDSVHPELHTAAAQHTSSAQTDLATHPAAIAQSVHQQAGMPQVAHQTPPLAAGAPAHPAPAHQAPVVPTFPEHAPAQHPATPPAAPPAGIQHPQQAAPLHTPAPGPSPTMSEPFSDSSERRQSASNDLDDNLNYSSGGKGKWVIMILMLLVGGGVGGLYATQPELFSAFLQPQIPELAKTHLADGYIALARDTKTSLTSAKSNFDKVTSLADQWAEGWAGLAEAELAIAEHHYTTTNLLEKKDKAKKDKSDEEKATTKELITQLREQASEHQKDAFKAAQRALELDPEGAAANRAMADFYRLDGALEKVGSLITKAQKADAQDLRITLLLGAQSLVSENGLDRAVRYFDQVLSRSDDMQRARFLMAKTYYKLSKDGEDKAFVEKSIKALETILKAESDHELAKLMLEIIKPPPAPEPEPEPEAEVEGEAEAQTEPGAEGEAPEKEEVKVQTVPQMLKRANRLRDREQTRKAMNLYEKILDEEPENAQANAGMGWGYIDMEKARVAIISFENALRFNPRLADAHMGMAEAANMLGKSDKAKKHYAKYLEIKPDGEDAPVARRMLETLK
ncbi:zinc-ribbon domain-containing protein [Myxococcota bacterium]|nr:zinc-ribbon domain-containing protein [Myxococcota bacterium]